MIRSLVAGAALIAVAAAVQAAEPTEPNVVARTAAMKTIGKNTKLLGNMAKGSVAFDASAAQQAALAIAGEAANIPSLFETQADDPASEAKPVIWQQYDDFTMKAADLEDAASAAAESILAQADIGPALGQLGAACKACHSTYRE
ncbi:cytochrome c [Mangrovicoccus sp. HB161399]|uniref:c-type cytochrome n=1 Tax=Mangrovicoccus sp. HB161399 TaxID=2720392 RepID=UPI001551902F|nr:cytochrome c [Mangrovicoccus sp. HB161399]